MDKFPWIVSRNCVSYNSLVTSGKLARKSKQSESEQQTFIARLWRGFHEVARTLTSGSASKWHTRHL